MDILIWSTFFEAKVMKKALIFLIFLGNVIGQIPDYWVESHLRGNFLYTKGEPESWVDSFSNAQNLFPSIANGYVGTVVMNDTVYISGVYNGQGANGIEGPSHRAAIPATLSISVVDSVTVAMGLDLQEAIVYRLGQITTADGTAQFEQRWFAHQFFPGLLVSTLEFTSVSGTVQLALNLTTTSSPDIAFSTEAGPPGSFVLSGFTNYAEENFTQRTEVAVCTSNLPETLLISGPSNYTFLATYSTSLNAGEPKQVAAELWTGFVQLPIEQLLASHVNAWAELWQSGLEVEGNLTIGLALNSSLYYLLSSVRRDWPYGISPGGIPVDAYNGHVFWDSETWMFPNLLLLQPALAEMLLLYRFNRIPAAQANAQSYNKDYQGAMYPWESGFSGAEVCPWLLGALYEQHITADVLNACAFFFYATQDLAWLTKYGWPLVNETATFWASRVEFNETKGQYVILGVVPPDESAGVVNNSVYTNAACQTALKNAIFLAGLLQQSTPPLWQEIVDRIYIPFDATLSWHPEYDGYAGELINQPDTVLLQYPLGLAMSTQTRETDVFYYINHTNEGSFFTGYNVYSILLLDLGYPGQALGIFERSFEFIQAPFNVWREEITGGHQNFITGAGGFLQNIIFGYSGLRITNGQFTFAPQLPSSCAAMKIREFSFQKSSLSLSWTSESATFEMSTHHQVLQVVTASGQAHVLRPSMPATFSLSEQPFQLQATS